MYTTVGSHPGVIFFDPEKLVLVLNMTCHWRIWICKHGPKYFCFCLPIKRFWKPVETSQRPNTLPNQFSTKYGQDIWQLVYAFKWAFPVRDFQERQQLETRIKNWKYPTCGTVKTEPSTNIKISCYANLNPLHAYKCNCMPTSSNSSSDNKAFGLLHDTASDLAW